MLVTLNRTELPELDDNSKDLVAQGFWGLYKSGSNYVITTNKNVTYVLDEEGRVINRLNSFPTSVSLDEDAYTFGMVDAAN